MKDKSFCDAAIDYETPPEGYKSNAAATYNGEDAGAFGGYTRTSSPNAVPEVSYDRALKEKPSGEPDQF